MSDDLFAWGTDTLAWGASPWTSQFELQPWMIELHRPGQEVAFLGRDGTQLHKWKPARRVFQWQCSMGIAYFLAVRRGGIVERVEFDKPIGFSGGDFQSVWNSQEPPQQDGWTDE